MKIYVYKECSGSKYIDMYKDVTPEILRNAADKLEECDVESFKFKNNTTRYGYSNNVKRCLEKRLETDAEMNTRIKKEQAKKIAEFKKIEKQRKDLILEAKKLGLVLQLQEERCINE